MKNITRSEAIVIMTREVTIPGWSQFSSKDLTKFLHNHGFVEYVVKDDSYFHYLKVKEEFFFRIKKILLQEEWRQKPVIILNKVTSKLKR